MEDEKVNVIYKIDGPPQARAVCVKVSSEIIYLIGIQTESFCVHRRGIRQKSFIFAVSFAAELAAVGGSHISFADDAEIGHVAEDRGRSRGCTGDTAI